MITAILSRALIERCLHSIANGASGEALAQGVGTAVTEVSRQLRATPVPAAQPESQPPPSEVDVRLAELLTEVGPDGIARITTVVDPSLREESVRTEHAPGVRVAAGYASPYFVTDGTSQEVVLTDADVLLHRGVIGSVAQILPLLEIVVRSPRPLVVVTEDLDAEVLATLVVNKLQQVLPCVAISLDGVGHPPVSSTSWRS